MASGNCQKHIAWDQCHHSRHKQPRRHVLLAGAERKYRQNHRKYQLEPGYTQDRNGNGNQRTKHDQSIFPAAPAASLFKIQYRHSRYQHTGHRHIMKSCHMKRGIGMGNATYQDRDKSQHRRLCHKGCC